MIFEFTEDDLAVGKLVEPGWNPVRVHKVILTEDKDGADLVKVQLKITSDGEFKGVILYTQFSEKGRGFAVPFIEALTGKKVEKGDRVTWGDQMVGRELEVYVQRGEYRGKPKNEIVDYRPIGVPEPR
jgi:hypothetical protein